MKTLLLMIALVITTNINAQDGDCNSPDNLPVFNAGVNFKEGYMSPWLKFGLWRNVAPLSGATAFIGYQDASAIRTAARQPNSKQQFKDTLRFADTWFFELGWKVRLNPKMMLHTYGGADAIKPYIGVDLFYQMGEAALIGLNYRKQSVGISFLVRFK